MSGYITVVERKKTGKGRERGKWGRGDRGRKGEKENEERGKGMRRDEEERWRGKERNWFRELGVLQETSSDIAKVQRIFIVHIYESSEILCSSSCL